MRRNIYELFFIYIFLQDHISAENIREIISFGSRNICSCFLIYLSGYDRFAQQVVADSGPAHEKLYLIRGPSRPVTVTATTTTTGEAATTEYNMQNGDHEPVVQGSQVKTEFSFRSRISVDGTSMDDESIENRCAPSGDANVPSTSVR